MINTRKIVLNSGTVSILLDVNPKSVTIEQAQMTKAMELLFGEYEHVGPSKLRRVQLSTFLPNDGSYFKRGAMTQKETVDTLNRWRVNRDTVTFSMDGMDSFPCRVTALSKTADEGDMDIGIAITLAEARTLTKPAIDTGASVAPLSRPAPPPPAKETQYTVKKGDCLYHIAKKFYGSGSKWRTIYERNKAVIGSNPNRIYPGQTLYIPEAG